MNDSDVVDEVLITLAERVAIEAQQLKIGAIDYPLYIKRRDSITKKIKKELDQHYASIREEAIERREAIARYLTASDLGGEIGILFVQLNNGGREKWAPQTSETIVELYEKRKRYIKDNDWAMRGDQLKASNKEEE